MTASNFGQDAKGIVIVRDEDFKELEMNSWIPVSKLAASQAKLSSPSDPDTTTMTMNSASDWSRQPLRMEDILERISPW